MVVSGNVYHNCYFFQEENGVLVVGIEKSSFGFGSKITLRDFTVNYDKGKKVQSVRNNKTMNYFYPAADGGKIQGKGVENDCE